MTKIVFITILLTSLLQAHALKIFINEQKDTLHVKAYFSKSSPCIECDTFIYDTKEKLLQTTKTDKKGEVIIPKLKQKVKIVVAASMGHKAQRVIENTNKAEPEYPMWIKITLGLTIIGGFFGGLYFAKRDNS